MHVWDATWTADSFFFLSPLRYTKRGMIIRNKYQVNKYPLMIPWSYCEDNLMLEGISFWYISAWVDAMSAYNKEMQKE